MNSRNAEAEGVATFYIRKSVSRHSRHNYCSYIDRNTFVIEDFLQHTFNTSSGMPTDRKKMTFYRLRDTSRYFIENHVVETSTLFGELKSRIAGKEICYFSA